MRNAEGHQLSQNTRSMINGGTLHKATNCNAQFRLLGALFAKFRRKKRNELTGALTATNLN